VKIAVVGGGISGLRAALTLARSGHQVTLFEKNRHLGGRVFSFSAPNFGEVDIGQHVWLKCCTALEELLADLGVPDDWVYRQDRFSLLYKRPDEPDFALRAAPLPWPLHLLPGFLVFPGLGAIEKLQLARAMARAWLYSSRSLEALDDRSFAEWLRCQRQSSAAIARMWAPIVLGVCNGRPEEVSARHALFTFRESLLKSRHAADICFVRRPLSAVFDRLARQALAAAGVEMVTGAGVQQVGPGTPVRVRIGAQARDFDRAILAVPARRCPVLLRGEVALPEPPADAAIAALLVKFARPVMDELFFLALDSPVQFVFNKTAIWSDPSAASETQIVELVISGARREIRMGVERVAAELLPELAKLLPRAGDTPVLARRLLVHGSATFAVPPGGEARRLPVSLAEVPNVYFAGDAAATGWPSTMESAARAGQSAARAVLAEGT
jgi:squalene-associated FAD-dependent desaturase